MILVQMIASVDKWSKGDRVLVEGDHWLLTSGYAKVVKRDIPDPDFVRTADDATSRVGVARRRPRKAMIRVQDSTEPGGGSTVGSDGGPQGSDESGDRSASSDEEDDA